MPERGMTRHSYRARLDEGLKREVAPGGGVPGAEGGRRADGHGTHPERYRSIRGGEEAVSAVRGHLLKDILPHGSILGEENQDFFGLLWSEAR